jgi:hypothetical protein
MPLKLISPGGGSVILSAPSTGSTYTLTVPAVTANVVTTGDANTITSGMIASGAITQASLASGLSTTGPAFSVTRGTNQNATNGGWTKINFNSEEYDTASCYDNSTNYRFTPNVAGYYQITVQVNVSFTSGAASTLIAAMYKNGSLAAQNYVTCAAIINTYGSSVTKLIYLNGSTDYIEGYVYQNNGGDRAIIAGSNASYMDGHLARAA